jgi:GNAT superfamily N-acetyltransferase
MPGIMTFRDDELPGDLRCQILSFHRLVWPEDFTGEDRLRHWIQPARYHPFHVAIVDAGVLVSYAGVMWKDLEHAGQTYRTYGLSGVLTYPMFRRQGYGRQVVEAATAVIRASDADIGLFVCLPHLINFYAASGWIPMPQAVLRSGPKSLAQPTQEQVMMGFFSPRGKRARPSFTSLPIDFDDVLW